MENNGYWSKRLQEVIDSERANHGLVGFRVFAAANRDADAEDIARTSVKMHEAFLAGDYTDISDQDL